MKISQVLIPKLKLFPLDYDGSEINGLKIGDIVIVNFRNREEMALVWSQKPAETPEHKIKKILKRAPLNLSIDQKHIGFLKKAANYYIMDIGSMLKLMLPVNIAKNPIKITLQEISNTTALPALEKEQQDALEMIQNDDKVALLHGVTGSGKTEIYYHLVNEALQAKEQVLIMLPEIALTKQMIQRFEERFGFQPIIWNSSVSESKKRQILRGIIMGSVKIVMGARSSLFLPYKNLKLIIVDEEHDQSYKQEEGIMYNARDMAVLKGKMFDSKVVLASASPSLESYNNAITQKYSYIKLNKRYSDSVMPQVMALDLKKENMRFGSWISKSLKKKMEDSLANNEQILLFLNRKGYAPLLLCSNCGYRFACINCSSWLVYHKSKKSLECHLCGYLESVKNSCPECLSEDHIIPCGPGVERLYEETTNLFPEAKIHIITKDEANKKGLLEELICQIKDNKINILIGTQIITKGYDFPSLNLVAVIDSDAAFMSSDLKSAENAFQLLHQVGGRAGRRSVRGTVILQTYFPEHFLIQILLSNNYDQFYKYELKTRMESQLPPFSKSCLIKIDAQTDLDSRKMAINIIRSAPKVDCVRIYGPTTNDTAIINRKHQYKILFVTPKNFNIQQYMSDIIAHTDTPQHIKVKLDIDPYKL